MSLSLRRVATTLIFVFTTALFLFFVLFDTYTWGKYAFLGLSTCIFIIGCGMNHGKVSLGFTPYIAMNVLFICFVLLSSLWAISSSDSATMARTLTRTFVCAYAVYITYINIPELDVTVLLKAVMWAGYIVSLYTLFFYGLDTIIAAGSSSSLRVDNEFANFDYLMGADLDFSNREVVEECKKWGLWYQKLTRVDGFRLDAVKHIDSKFYKEWLTYIREQTQKSYLRLENIGRQM